MKTLKKFNEFIFEKTRKILEDSEHDYKEWRKEVEEVKASRSYDPFAEDSTLRVHQSLPAGTLPGDELPDPIITTEKLPEPNLDGKSKIERFEDFDSPDTNDSNDAD